MMNANDVEVVCKKVTLPHKLEVIVGPMDSGSFIQVCKVVRDNRSKRIKSYAAKGRKWYISSHAVENEVVFTCWKACLTWVEHEMREEFEYEGHKIFDPHTSVASLVEACQSIETRK